MPGGGGVQEPPRIVKSIASTAVRSEILPSLRRRASHLGRPPVVSSEPKAALRQTAGSQLRAGDSQRGRNPQFRSTAVAKRRYLREGAI